jgi:hypothetical protein
VSRRSVFRAASSAAFNTATDLCHGGNNTTPPVEPGAQGIHFYCWTADIIALRRRLIGDGLAPGPIEHPEHMENGEFHLDDPDAYHLIVGQVRRSR